MEKLIIHSPKSAQLQEKPWKPNPKLIGSELSQRRPPVWDCGSSLYDSFELNSLQRRLDSARHARSLSLPHLGADHRLQPPQPKPSSTGGSKLSRSLKKFMRSVFFRGKSKALDNDGVNNSGKGKVVEEERRWFVMLEDDVVFEKGNEVLSAIPEAPEIEKKAGLVSPEIGGVVRKIAPARFVARSSSMNVISSRGLAFH